TAQLMKFLSRARFALEFLSLAFLLVAPASAEVLKIVLNDTIQPVTDEFIGRALAEAKAKNDQALLIEINTPGGLVESTREIIEKIVDSPVPVIVYVTPSGSRAASAGFFILESADIAAMAPGTNTGAAHPVTLGGSKMDDVMKQKVENDLAALMRSVASRRGRNVDIAESGVRESKSFTEQEALSKKLIDYVASSEDDLFRQIAAHPIKRFDGKTITLNIASHGVLTTGGIVLLTLGGLLLVDAPIPEMQVHLLTALAVSIPLGVITAFLMSIALRARRNKVVTGPEGLIGEVGIARTPIAPRGTVFVHGEIWNATSPKPIEA